MWTFLDLVVQDWKREAKPFQENIDNATTESEEIYFSMIAHRELEPHYFKCLFSYIMFFVALEHAYDICYRELNTLNKQPFLQVPHAKRPKANAYIQKVKTVRDISIAHLGSNKARPIDSAAGSMWYPMSWKKESGNKWEVDKMTFRGTGLVTHDISGNVIDQAIDMEIGGITELHKVCMNYLDEYDRFCADFLNSIMALLPVTIDDLHYFVFKST